MSFGNGIGELLNLTPFGTTFTRENGKLYPCQPNIEAAR
jgi:hypothetical protein